MKLYDVALSPFAARVRVQIYAKSLDIPLVAPPGGTGSDEYKRLSDEQGRLAELLLRLLQSQEPPRQQPTEP